MKGCYCLIIELKQNSKIRIGKTLGIIEFENGNYVYVGFALNSLNSRLNRHISDNKKLHWHIDYLLKDENAKITEILYNISDEKVECDLSNYLSAKTESIKGFGCSDCDCNSHLYYFKTKKEAIECIESAYESIAMKYEYFKI